MYVGVSGNRIMMLATANVINISGFGALSIGSGIIAAVSLWVD